MRFLVIAACLPLLLLAAISSAASADPSFLGPTGNLLTPAAGPSVPRQCALSLHHQPQWNVIAVNYSPRDYAELGVTVQDPTKPGPYQTQLGLNARVLVARENPQSPAIAVGILDVFDWVREAPYRQSGYIVASKDVRTRWSEQPWRVSLGLGGGVFRNGFLGVSAPIRSEITAIAEYDGTYINLGARAALPHGFLLDVGTVGWKLGVGASFITGW